MRITGLDIARFIAIVGMMAAHLVVTRSDAPFGELTLLAILTTGIPSAMFAVIGGFGVYLTSQKYLRVGAHASAVVNLMVRGTIIAAIGALLELLPEYALSIILIYYGVAIILSAPLILLPSWILASIAIILPFIESPLGYHLAHAHPVTQISEVTSIYKFLLTVLFMGTYPAMTWLAYLLIGLICARYLMEIKTTEQLQRRSTFLAAGGVGAFGIAQFSNYLVANKARPLAAELWGLDPSQGQFVITSFNYGTPILPPPLNLFVTAPHSGSPADVLNSAGITMAIVGVLIVTTVGLRKTPWVLRLFMWTGAIPLTVYTLHIVMASIPWPSVDEKTLLRDPNAFQLYQYEFWMQIVVVLVVGVLVGLSKRRGPLEYLVARLSSTAANLVGNKTRKNVSPKISVGEQSS